MNSLLIDFALRPAHSGAKTCLSVEDVRLGKVPRGKNQRDWPLEELFPILYIVTPGTGQDKIDGIAGNSRCGRFFSPLSPRRPDGIEKKMASSLES
jgi:hypothetical protein